jgi:hypothetical protein
MEATAGVEPASGGFADLCLTTWLRRPEPKAGESSELIGARQYSFVLACRPLPQPPFVGVV